MAECGIIVLSLELTERRLYFSYFHSHTLVQICILSHSVIRPTAMVYNPATAILIQQVQDKQQLPGLIWLTFDV